MTDTFQRAQRIVILLDDFRAGGVERVAISLANAWRRGGRDVTLLCGVDDGPLRQRVAPGVTVVPLRRPIPYSSVSAIRLGWAYARALNRLPTEVVFAPGNSHLPSIGVIARLQPRRRRVLACKLSNRLYRDARSRAAQRTFLMAAHFWSAPLDGVVAMSPNLQQEARRALRRNDICAIWEACVADDVVPVMQPPAANQTPTVVVAGRLAAEKNVGLALQAFRLLARHADTRLQIIGDGPLRSALTDQARQLGIEERIEWSGHVDDIRPYLAHASALLSTSDYEGYPAVLIEALAAAVPVVTTDSSPAVPEILFDPSFGIVAPRTPEALADALTRAFSLRPEPSALAMLVARHRVDHSARAYLAWFDRLWCQRREQ